MKKTKILFVSLLAMLVVLAGCGQGSNGGTGANNGGEAEGQLIEIEMLSSWSTDTERGRALHDMIDRFNEENAGKIKVNVDINPDWPSYQEKVKTMIAADQTPDLFNYNFNPNDLSRQESGKLLDFTPHMDEEWKSRFKEEDLEALTIDGQLTSVPFEKAGVLFYYNKDLFAQAGIESFPTTWEEFFEVCEQLQASGITPISLMTSDDAWYSTNVLSYLAAAAGGMNVFDVGQPLDTPEMIQAAELLKQMFEYSTPDAIGANYAISSSHFILGNTAMVIDGPWLIGSLDPETLDSIGVAPAPVFEEGEAQHGFIITDTYTPWSAGKQQSQEKEEAIVDFMKFLTSEESSKHLTLEGKILLSSTVELNDEEQNEAGPILSSFIEIGNNAPESLIQISRVLKPMAINKLPSLIEGLVLNQYTPEQFVQELQRENQ